MQRISASQAARIRELTTRIDPQLFRTLMTPEDRRIIDPRRLARWQEGRGILRPAESERLALISANAPLVENLAKKNQNKVKWKRNRAIRDWIAQGKDKETNYQNQDTDTRENQLKAIIGLRFLGVDPSEGTYYVRKRKA